MESERAAAVVDLTSEQKRALLARLLREKAQEPQTHPLALAQQRLWFLEQLQPGTSLYTISMPLRLSGALDVAALHRGLNEIVRRHAALRSTFPSMDGQPVQRIAPTYHLPLPLVDLRAVPENAREEQALQLAAEALRRPFDLAQGPLLRATLLRLDAAEHLLLVTVHHIVFDGWSMGVFFKELSTLYNATVRGRVPSPLPELPLQYADFARWQRAWLQGDVLEQQLAYWREHLRGAPAVLALPTDHPRPPVQTVAGARHPLTLSPAVADALRALSRQEGVTLFMTLLAAFQVLLARYSGQDDIVVGVPIANRTRAELEGLIGCFVNTLAVRTDLSGNPTFRELLGRVREVALGAYAHQDLPFEKLVEVLQVARDPSYTPLVQALFVLQNVPREELDLAGLRAQPLDMHDGTAKFDLTLNLEDTAQGLQGWVEYNSDLFEPATIARLAGHWQTLLESIVADPAQRVAALPLLTEAERRQLLVEWPQGPERAPSSQGPSDATAPASVPSVACLHDLFAAQVRRTPDAVAVSCEGRHLTYRELDSRADALAHYLQSLGVGPDTLVGLCMERSLEMVVGLLGILKAGGAYVPLDPAYPPERLAFMLQDAGAPILVTQERLLPRLPTHQATTVLLDRDWPLISRARTGGAAGRTGVGEGDVLPSPARPRPSATNLAYVIYTSGSTGRPKGSLITHANVVRLFTATQEWFHFDEHDVWTLFHSYAFDFSVWELWGALLHGGRLVVVPYAVSRSPHAFYDLLCAEGVTVLNQTPSAFHGLMRVDESAGGGAGGDPGLHPAPTRVCPGRALRLRLVIFGGEALEIGALKPWFDRHGDQQPQLVNMYGITETTVHVTYRPLTRADLHAAVGSAIGVPIPDLQVYVLDRHRQPVPVGVPGELYVGGAGLARGYLNRPDLTAERFIPHPFSSAPGARLYRSGDLARYRPDGTLEYLGRSDQQVKIRGFRIELGEIEAVLTQHPAVRETVVVAREEGSTGDKRLVAYLVAASPHAPTESELRAFLRQRLPEYMVPAAFVLLEALPLTPHGKVDRRALPAPAQSRRSAGGGVPTRPTGTHLAGAHPWGAFPEALVTPTLTLHYQLIEIWERLLDVRPIAITDNFFDLGGHSLLAVRLVDEIEQLCGKRIPLATLFADATIERLADVLLRPDEDSTEPILVPLQTGGSKPPFIFLHGDYLGGGFYCARLAEALGPDQPFYALRPHGLGGGQVPRTFEEMADDYLRLLRQVQPDGPYYLGGFCDGGLAAFEVARRLQAEGHAVNLLVLIDTVAANPRLRFVGRMIRRIGHLAALPYSEQLRCYLLLRYYEMPFKAFWGLQKGERRGVVLHEGQQRLAAAARALGRRGNRASNGAQAQAPRPSGRPWWPGLTTRTSQRTTRKGLPGPDLLRGDLVGTYQWVKSRYVPGHYPGRLTLLWARDEGIERGADPTMGWRDRAAAVAVYTVPGAHLTTITTHVEALAARLRACLDAAQEDGPGHGEGVACGG